MSQQINLFNPIFLNKRKYFSSLAMAQSMGLLILGGLLVSGYAHFQAKSLVREAEITALQLQTAQAQLARVRAGSVVRQKDPAIERDIAKLESDIRSYRQAFDTLQKGELGNTKGYAEYMRAFSRQIVDGVWLTGFEIVGAGNEIEIRGRALQPERVPLYMNGLKREPVMQGKSFATLNMQAPKAEAPKAGVTAATESSAKPHEPPGFVEFVLR
jgi:Tfp pilus assembly protein PilN